MPGTNWANPANNSLSHGAADARSAAPFCSTAPLLLKMIGLLPFFLAAFAWSPAALPVRVEYDGAGKGGSDKKHPSASFGCAKPERNVQPPGKLPVSPQTCRPGICRDSAFTESSWNPEKAGMKELSFIWKKPPSGLVGAAYSSVDGGDRELSFDWVEKPFSR